MANFRKSHLVSSLFSVVMAAVVAASSVTAMPAMASEIKEPVQREAMRGLTAMQIVNDMGAGWNLGNSLESDMDETRWGNPVTTKEMIDDIAEMGYTTLRVPVRWDDHYDSNAASAYTIQTSYMERVEEVVNYGLDNDMYVILNVHHNDLQHNVPNTEAISEELSVIWTQIGNHFKNYGDKLIFEVNNEPRKGDDWTGNATYYKCVNDCNEAARAAIRATGGNNSQRLVMLPTYCASGDYVKAAAWTKDPDDDMIAVSIHAYLPYDFAFDGNGHTDWRDSDVQELQQFFYRMDKLFLKKGIPVVIGEFGSRYKGVDNLNDRIKCINEFTKLANEYAEQSIPCVWWDNNCFTTNGENFGIYNRHTCEWVYESIAQNQIFNYETSPREYDYEDGNIELASNVSCSNWGQAASFDAATLILLEEDESICCDYASNSKPQFIMQSFTNQNKGWVQVDPESNDGYTASWSRSYLLEKFGGTFNDLDKIYIGDTGANLTVSNIYIPQCDAHSHTLSDEYIVTVPATATTPRRRVQECTYKDCEYVKVTTFTESNEDVSLTAPELEACFYVNDQVFLSWSSVSDITGYRIYRSTSADGEKTLIHINNFAQIGYYDTDISDNGGTYYYWVTAYNEDTGKESAYSNVMVVNAPKLYDMIRFDSVTSNSVTLSWDAIAGMTYRVYCSTTPGSIGVNNLVTSMDGITETTLKVTGLTPNTTYYFAINCVGNGSIISKEVSTTTLEELKKPTNLNVTTDGKTVSLTWDSVDGATSYRVYRADTVTGTKTLLKTVGNAYTYDATVTAGNTYYYFVAAYNSKTGVLSEYSEAKSVKVVAPLATPVITSATSDGKTVNLAWNVVDGTTSYRVYRADSVTGTKTLLKTVGNAYTYDATVTAGKTYYYFIVAYSSKTGELSEYSAAKSVKVVAPLATPVITSATSDGKTVNLAWNAVTGATSYRVYRADSATGTKTLLKTVGNAYTYDATVTEGKTYYYFVAAYSSKTATLSAYSAAKSVTVAATLAAPTITSATTSGTTINLKWTAVDGATSYRVYRADSATGAKTLLKVVGNPYTYDATVTAGKTYHYFVVAYSSKTGTLSAYSAAKAVTALATPVITSATSANGTVNLAWNAVSTATSYRIYRATSATGAKTLLKTVGNPYTYDATVTEGTTYYYFIVAYDSKTGTSSTISAAAEVTAE